VEYYRKSFIRDNRVKKISSEPDAVIKRATSDSRAIGSRPLDYVNYPRARSLWRSRTRIDHSSTNCDHYTNIVIIIIVVRSWGVVCQVITYKLRPLYKYCHHHYRCQVMRRCMSSHHVTIHVFVAFLPHSYCRVCGNLLPVTPATILSQHFMLLGIVSNKLENW